MQNTIIETLNKVLTSEDSELTQQELKLKENLSVFIKNTITENLSIGVQLSTEKDDCWSVRVDANLSMGVLGDKGEEKTYQFSEDTDSDTIYN